MKGYVEFTGKTLDEAIKEACSYFGVEREKLEIEIVSDAKMGIFGLVGAKKASLRARRVQLGDIGLSFGEGAGESGKKPGKGRGRGHDNHDRPEREERKPQGKDSQSGEAGREQNNNDAADQTKSGRATSSRAVTGQAADSQLQARPAGEIELHRDNLPMNVGPNALAVYEPATGGGSDSAEGCGQKRQPRGRKEAEKRERQPREKGRKAQDTPYGKETREAGERGGNSEVADHSGQRGRGKRNGAGDTREARNGRGPIQHQAQQQARSSCGKGAVREAGDDFQDDAMPDFEGSLPVVPLESLDQELLRETVLVALKELATPIVGEFEAGLEVSGGRVRLRVNSAENQGLLIGRDGQTLASLQYLLCCIASRKLNASVRVQIDAGDYREKQDEKLRDLALSLAQKVKSRSRPQSTRPLSAYHRRIIHMTLQEDPDVQTHSKGEGGMKRVVVVPRRKPVVS